MDALQLCALSDGGEIKYTETLLGARWATDLHIHPCAFHSLDLEDYNHTRLKYSRTTSNLCYANPHSKVQVTRGRHSCRVCRYFIWRKTEIHSIWEPLCTSSADIFIVCIILITIPELTPNVWCCTSYPFPYSFPYVAFWLQLTRNGKYVYGKLSLLCSRQNQRA